MALTSLSLPVEVAELAAAQQNCPDCQRAISSPYLRVISLQLEGEQVRLEASSGVMRLLVPAAFCCRIFDSVHSLPQLGTRATGDSSLPGNCCQTWPRMFRSCAETVVIAKGQQ
jgi:hypothetical protein